MTARTMLLLLACGLQGLSSCTGETPAATDGPSLDCGPELEPLTRRDFDDWLEDFDWGEPVEQVLCIGDFEDVSRCTSADIVADQDAAFVSVAAGRSALAYSDPSQEVAIRIDEILCGPEIRPGSGCCYQVVLYADLVHLTTF